MQIGINYEVGLEPNLNKTHHVSVLLLETLIIVIINLSYSRQPLNTFRKRTRPHNRQFARHVRNLCQPQHASKPHLLMITYLQSLMMVLWGTHRNPCWDCFVKAHLTCKLVSNTLTLFGETNLERINYTQGVIFSYSLSRSILRWQPWKLILAWMLFYRQLDLGKTLKNLELVSSY